MKPFKFYPKKLIVAFILFMQLTSLNAQQEFSIIGLVIDSSDQKRLPAAKVELLISENSLKTVLTNSDGYFNLNFSKLQAFRIRVSLDGYRIYTSSLTEVNPSTKNISLGTISLSKIITDIISTREFVTQNLINIHYVTTEGAYILFYALNPDLKEKSEVPRSYKRIYPSLPKFQPVKRIFKKRFKKDKKRDEPYIYAGIQPYMKGGEYSKSSYLPNYPTGYFENSNSIPTAIGVNNGYFNSDFGITNLYSGKTKKFVFVFFKLDANGNPVFLENRYKVYYYPDNVKGDESLYNKAGNATYGYAPMKAKIYNVEVYDQQQNNKRVSVSDDQIDPLVFFLRFDVFNSWIKIPIQVYE
jgi:hypothetical protein